MTWPKADSVMKVNKREACLIGNELMRWLHRHKVLNIGFPIQPMQDEKIQSPQILNDTTSRRLFYFLDKKKSLKPELV